jgi:hypothetical protein
VDQQKLIEIRNEIYNIEKQLISLNRYTYSETAWRTAHNSGHLQEMMALLEESIDSIKKASNSD